MLLREGSSVPKPIRSPGFRRVGFNHGMPLPLTNTPWELYFKKEFMVMINKGVA